MVEWVCENFSKGSTCLDVGACDGKWADLLGNYLTMDAIEIFSPNVGKHKLAKKYRNVFVADIRGFQYFEGDYDLIIFGISALQIKNGDHQLPQEHLSFP